MQLRGLFTQFGFGAPITQPVLDFAAYISVTGVSVKFGGELVGFLGEKKKNL